jgi:uncharacterized protein YoxC
MENKAQDMQMGCLDSRSMVEALDKFADTFQASARRWEIIVYPSLFAFVILAGYGFFLIYSLTSNASQMTLYMAEMNKNFVTVTQNMAQVTSEMAVVSEKMSNMSEDTRGLTQSINSMNQQIYTMNRNIHVMTASMNRMGTDMGHLNRSISKPADFVNDFLPW